MVRLPSVSNSSSEGVVAERDERVLVVRLSSLGDVLLAAPAVRALRARFPSSGIDFLVASEYAAAAALIPCVDRVLTFDRRGGVSALLRARNRLTRCYTVLVDLQNSARSAFLRATTFPTIWVKAKRYRLRRWLRVCFKWNLYREVRPVPVRYLDSLGALGARDDGRGLELRVPADAREWAGAFLTSGVFVTDSVVALCPGARHTTKRWPAERWTELCRKLSAAGSQVLVVGSSSEDSLLAQVAGATIATVVCGRSIHQVAALFERSALVISNDSGLMHLATGVGRPVVGIFGPTVEEFGFYPFRANSEVISHDLPCRPCSAMGGERCPAKHFRCMLETTVDDVLARANALLVRDRLQSS